jgi:hypothetical protein
MEAFAHSQTLRGNAPMSFKSLRVAALVASLPLVAQSSAFAQAYTTRIEPRPFYGAVVTLEEGVRVIRPLPPERHVIINPDNATPLSLGFNETRVYENRTIRNYHYGDSGSSSSSSSSYGRAGFYGPSFATGGAGHHGGRAAGQAIGKGSGHGGGHGRMKSHGGGHR